MKPLKLKVRFLTPAFLGDAEQKGVWRVPPFKAQLRYWWRFVYAASQNHGVDIERMRQAEGELFGAASGGSGYASKVRMRLDRWRVGNLEKWDSAKYGAISHPEVGRSVSADLYLGYGPLTYDKKTKTTAMATAYAIDAGQSAWLKMACPNCSAEQYQQLYAALALMHHFGQVGSRSRNGWGSYVLEEGLPDFDFDLQPFVRNWQKALELTWPHAIGQDENGPCIWETAPFSPEKWPELMHQFADLKVNLRILFPFYKANTNKVEMRHWLSYPITHHMVKSKSWRQRRIPNTLRFKVVKTEDGKIKGRLLHTPCRPDFSQQSDLGEIEEVWRKVYQFLDQRAELKRVQQV